MRYIVSFFATFYLVSWIVVGVDTGNWINTWAAGAVMLVVARLIISVRKK